MTSALSIQKLTVTYQQDPVLWDVSVDIAAGSMLAIVGPNGAGKTTLIKAIVGLVTPMAGVITLFGKPFYEQRTRVAYMPQRMSVDWDFPISVQEVVMMGRYGSLGWLRRPQKKDYDIVQNALAQVDLLAHAHVPIGQLSGGQQQRVFFARAVAQQADIYLLDEPLINLDMVTEQALVRVLQDLARAGKTVVVVHHDLHTVSTYFDTALLINIKKIAYGPVAQVMTRELITAAYAGVIIQNQAILPNQDTLNQDRLW